MTKDNWQKVKILVGHIRRGWRDAYRFSGTDQGKLQAENLQKDLGISAKAIRSMYGKAAYYE